MNHSSFLRVGIVTLFLALGLCSCKQTVIYGEGQATPETRPLDDFTALNIEVPVNATIVLDGIAQPSIIINTEPNIAAHITTSIQGKRLNVTSDAHLHSDGGINVEIHAKSLSALRFSGAVDALLKGAVDAQHFDIDLTGASNLVIEQLNTQNLSVDLTGASKLNIKQGSVDVAEYDVTGAGEVMAFGLLTNTADADLTGACEMEMNVLKDLNANISGAGTIRYKGSPKVTSDISGVGDISAVN